MAGEKPTDPNAAFRDLVTQWERNFDSFANQFMGTEGFSQAMNQTQKAQNSAQKAFAENMANQLASMNVPTRDDLLRLAETVQRIDTRLERIEEKLGIDTLPRSALTKRPPRTKQPPQAKAEPKAEAKDKSKGKSKSKAKASKEKKDE